MFFNTGENTQKKIFFKKTIYLPIELLNMMIFDFGST